ncbi:hypothetical protein NLU14_07905 [Marinobacter sp. 71-i]|uniref:Uncharacterized protein n=1 Tax=Marinobacter iranensis TaxID=2962607 RepID=A0ABT5Y912_9GAMM|nr:hypothetical protein [Marinobacter iranensis]MDF0750155.1 hypothetical protein [Marinobacter iranensis]
MIGQIIESIWPRLEGSPVAYDDFLDNDTEIPEENLEKSIEFAILMYEKQKERVSTIESKSSIYLGFFGTVIAILFFALKDLFFKVESGIAYDVAIMFGGILIIYILQVMHYAIKALERRGYHSIDESEFLHGDKRRIAVDLINNVKKNYDVINAKVDCMTMAHEFTKRILWMILIAAVALVILPLTKYSSVTLVTDIKALSLEFDLRLSDYILTLVVAWLTVSHYQILKIKNKIKK